MVEAIRFYQEALDPAVCRLILQGARTALAGDGGFSRTNASWEPHVVRASAPVLIRDLDAANERLVTAMLQARGVLPQGAYRVMQFTWPPMSYIPWHNDAQHALALTIYLNEEWDPDWGGLFLYRAPDDGEVRGVVPRFNLGLRNNQQLPHATSMVTPDAPEPRFTLQIFPARAD